MAMHGAGHQQLGLKLPGLRRGKGENQLTPVPRQHFSHIHVVLVEPLPASREGFLYLFTIIDKSAAQMVYSTSLTLPAKLGAGTELPVEEILRGLSTAS